MKSKRFTRNHADSWDLLMSGLRKQESDQMLHQGDSSLRVGIPIKQS